MSQVLCKRSPCCVHQVGLSISLTWKRRERLYLEHVLTQLGVPNPARSQSVMHVEKAPQFPTVLTVEVEEIKPISFFVMSLEYFNLIF